MTNTSYEIAKSKGWHDHDELGTDGTPSARQRLAWVALILTEWVEWQDDERDGLLWLIEDSGKPVGAISECVDIWIRCADTLGACGEPLSGAVAHVTAPSRVDSVCYMLGCAAEATRTGNHSRFAELLRAVMVVIADESKMLCQCDTVSVTPEAALAAKEAYNRTRSTRHGGKLA